jgi:hypothetical protein
VVDARKNRYAADAVWDLLQQATTIVTAKGKKVQTWQPQTDAREAILKQAMGPSGNLRAPTLRRGDQIVIGFNADFYAQWLNNGIAPNMS